MSVVKSPPTGIHAIIFLLAAVFFTHFLLINDFGLYEDDYAQAYFVNADKDLSDAIEFASVDIARPVGRFLRASLSYIGSALGGIVAIYFIAYLIVSLNAVLVYLIIRHLAPGFVALAGAMVFCLYPADTTKTLLTHAFHLQTGLSFILLGIFLYQKGRRVSPYILGFLSLLTYEPTILPLLAAPFLKQKKEQKIGKEILINIAAIFALIVLVLAYRNFAGEVRVTGLESFYPLDLITRILVAMGVGPLTSSAMFLYRPYTVFLEGNIYTGVFIAIFFIITFLFLKRYVPEAVEADKLNISVQTKRLPFQINIRYLKAYEPAFRLFITGIVLWSLSYLFAFSNEHWPPVEINNRTTSVHFAATVAASLAMAGIIWIAYIFFWVTKKKPMLFVALISAYFSVLAGFSFIVQQDYALSWTNQKNFWGQVIKLTPDIDADKVVFFVANRKYYSRQTKYIFNYSWGDVIVLSTLYKYTRDNKPVYEWRTPRFDNLGPSTRNSFRFVDGVLTYDSFSVVQKGKEKIEIKDTNNIIILYIAEDGSVKRYRGIVRFNGIRIRITGPSQATSLPGTKIHDLIMDSG